MKGIGRLEGWKIEWTPAQTGVIKIENATIHIPESIFERARIKAQEEDKAVEQIVRDLLDGWLDGAIHLATEKRSREELVSLARAAKGMWADRDPDQYLALSRAGLDKRDVVKVVLPTRLVAQMKFLVDQGWFPDIDEFIADAVRRFLETHSPELIENSIWQDVEWGLHGTD